jgi:hypothetical protein
VKIMLRAAISVFSLGIGSAYACEGDGHSATALLASIQNEQFATARTAEAQNIGAARSILASPAG